MAIKIRQNGIVKDLVINASEVAVLDVDGNFKSKNLETILKQIATTGTGGSGTGGSGYPSDAEFVYVKDTEPDMDGVWLDESDVTSDDSSVGSNSVVKEIKSYVNSETSKINASLTNAKAELEEKDAELLNKIGILNNGVNQISNPNLLINSDFQVNQRNQTTYTTTGKAIYTVDRWISYNLTNDTTEISVLSNGIKVKSTSGGNGRLRQTLEENDTKKLVGKTLTFSIKVLSNCSQCWLLTTKRRDEGGSEKRYTNVKAGDVLSLTFDVTSDYTQLGVQFSSNDTNGISVAYAKLEVGSIVTPFSPKPYSQELADCQRYYCTEDWSSANVPRVLYKVSEDYQDRGLICFPTEMRITPTINLVWGDNVINNSSYVGKKGIDTLTSKSFVPYVNRSSAGINNKQFVPSVKSYTADAEIY